MEKTKRLCVSKLNVLPIGPLPPTNAVRLQGASCHSSRGWSALLGLVPEPFPTLTDITSMFSPLSVHITTEAQKLAVCSHIGRNMKGACIGHPHPLRVQWSPNVRHTQNKGLWWQGTALILKIHPPPPTPTTLCALPTIKHEVNIIISLNIHR